MLSKAQQKLIRSLQTKKGREAHGACLVEGAKVIEAAGDAVKLTFSREDVETEKEFLALVTTQTPQEVAAVAKIPKWSVKDIDAKKTIVVLDGVQDPGNVGAILRLCLAFDASLVFVESADVTSPKVVRSSAGALFHVPWMKVNPDQVMTALTTGGRDIYRLELRETAIPLSQLDTTSRIVLIAGSEGQGIKLDVEGTSVRIEQADTVESLNVANALAIALHARFM